MEYSNSAQVVNLGSVGGAGSSATAGGFNQGNQIAGVRATGDSSPRMAGSPKAGGDVRVGGHFGPTTDAAVVGGYNQGDQFAATLGDGSAVKGNLKTGGDVRNGPGKSAPEASGYAQGDQFAGKKK